MAQAPCEGGHLHRAASRLGVPLTAYLQGKPNTSPSPEPGMAVAPCAERRGLLHPGDHHVPVTQREGDRRLCATFRETRSSSDTRAAGARGTWGPGGDSTSQEELCLEVEVVERGVSDQQTRDFGHVTLRQIFGFRLSTFGSSVVHQGCRTGPDGWARTGHPFSSLQLTPPK